jgi:maltooligosyltrehalose trehalohydrolase
MKCTSAHLRRRALGHRLKRSYHALADLGVTVLEVMPVADFPGRYGWGYDGVNLFAPTRLYGNPDDFRHFVDRAHALGLGVILDVVYNHLGPDGNHLKQFAEHYFSKRHSTEWGEALNFDGEHNEPVREYFCANAAYWISEFHIDGLRLDATQQIFDSSSDHIIAALVSQRSGSSGQEERLSHRRERTATCATGAVARTGRLWP